MPHCWTVESPTVGSYLKQVKQRGLIPAALAAALLLPAVAAAAQEHTSAHFRLSRVALVQGAESVAAPSFVGWVDVVSVGETVGVCPTGRRTTVGPLSLMGAGRVPVRLNVQRGTGVLDDVELSWSGQAPEFDIYRSASPVDLVQPGNHLESTVECERTDVSPPPFDILFYRVEPSPTRRQP